MTPPKGEEEDDLWTSGCAKQKSLAYKRKWSAAEKEEDKVLRREKNRIAARVSRARKLECLLNLQNDLDALQKANTVMQDQLSQIQAKAIVAQQSHLTLKEEIEHFTNLGAPEESQILGSVLELIFSLSDPCQRDPSPAHKAAPGQLQLGRELQPIRDKRSKRKGCLCTRGQNLRGSQPRGASVAVSNRSSPFADLPAVLLDESDVCGNADLLDLDAPLLGDFPSSRIPFDSPMHWLFY